MTASDDAFGDAPEDPRGRLATGRAHALFSLGVIGAAILAAVQVADLGPAVAPLPEGVVARVGELEIRDDELRRALDGLARDRRDGLQEGDRARALDRLIDEALLVQLALDEGLAYRDARTRTDLSAAALELLSSGAGLDEPTDEELRVYYEANVARLRRPTRIRLRESYRANDAAPGTESTSPLPLPSGWLSRSELAQRLGAERAAEIVATPVGQRVGPFDFARGQLELEVVERDTRDTPPMEEIRDSLADRWRRERGERAVLEHLERARTQIAIQRR